MHLLDIGSENSNMENKLSKVGIKITRFVDPYNPGVVEGQLTDAEGLVHTFVDKVPIFTSEMLDASSTYPQKRELECRVLAQSQDKVGRPLVRIRTIESTDGKTEFVVLSSQIL
jgi:hypothetical protein